MSRKPVILLMGPTASGKTDLAIELSRHYPVDLVSVDSALIYRGMDIGTAKPDAETLRLHPHALVDILDPAERYSAWQFVRDAREQIERSHAAGRIPLLVGGTMLYFHALMNGLNELPQADPGLRADLEAQRRQRGLAALHEELRQVDPEAALRIRPSDPQRILRALEVYHLTGRPLSELQAEPARPAQRNFVPVSLVVADRGWLHQRIEQRFGQMLEQGFEQEVQGLRARGGLSAEMPSMRCVGYRQMWDYLEGKLSRQEMVERAIIATRQLAKRQITWLRKFPDQGRFEVNGLDFDSVRHYLDSRLSLRG